MMYTYSKPRRWTKRDIGNLIRYKDIGYSNREIGKLLNRTEVSIGIKLKRLSKSDNSYNSDHFQEKMNINIDFLEFIKPITVLDLYCGNNLQYSNYKTIRNDKENGINADYNKDALKLLCELYSKNEKYDFIDLDPFGSAYDCFDLSIKMAKKGLAITLGELGHKRWKRLDYVSRFYGINNMSDFTIDNIINEIVKIGIRNKKELVIYKHIEWKNIGRVWIEIKKAKPMPIQLKQK